MKNILPFEQIHLKNIDIVGGKNASLGEMISNLSKVGVSVPPGFATTALAFRAFLAQNNVDKKITELLAKTDSTNVDALNKSGAQIRQWILETPFLPDFERDVREAYEVLAKKIGRPFSVAVRSSATAEDLPNASFAGQQETLLNIEGQEALLKAIKQVFSSLYEDRAIAYRDHHGFLHAQVALSVGVQLMVRSDKAASGVLFTLDTESGFDQVVFITSAYGLGETVVQGAVNPDEFYVYKSNIEKKLPAILRKTLGTKAIKMIYGEKTSEPTKIIEVASDARKQFSISDEEITALAEQALLIEKHYGRPMDIEWAKDGNDGKLYIVQARPETVKSRACSNTMEQYSLRQKGDVISSGRSIGQKIGKGSARIIKNILQANTFQEGEVLVTDMTDPNWEIVMKKASAIVTNRGGRTCHAAIIARELGIPAVVGCGDATDKVKNGETITVSCAEGDTGFVYRGDLAFDLKKMDINNLPPLKTKIMMNVANPDRAFSFHQLPHHGIGLARLEFIINNIIGIHPQALLAFETLPADLKAKIQERIAGYASPVDFYVEKLTEGIATLAASVFPHPIIVRLSDFKSNEYASLLGGELFEPEEENPMLGFRGAARYIADSFRDCFALECKALKKARETMGFSNIQIMVPFVRTLTEAKAVLALLEKHGLKRGEKGLNIQMMCEIPSNVLLADEFLKHFDGFSIGSNDLTQLTLGVDRDSGLVANSFDERDPAVKKLLKTAIETCNEQSKYIGICGQGPSDYPDFAEWLVEQGIKSISLNPDTVLKTYLFLAEQ